MTLLNSLLFINQYGENSSQVQHIQIQGNITTTKAHQYWGDEFHLYQAVWSNTSYSFLLDDLTYLQIDLTKDKGFDSYQDANNPFFFLVNFALGGNWPGKAPDPRAFPARLELDWIRVWQQENSGSQLHTHDTLTAEE